MPGQPARRLEAAADPPVSPWSPGLPRLMSGRSTLLGPSRPPESRQGVARRRAGQARSLRIPDDARTMLGRCRRCLARCSPLAAARSRRSAPQRPSTPSRAASRPITAQPAPGRPADARRITRSSPVMPPLSPSSATNPRRTPGDHHETTSAKLAALAGNRSERSGHAPAGQQTQQNCCRRTGTAAICCETAAIPASSPSPSRPSRHAPRLPPAGRARAPDEPPENLTEPQRT